MEAVSSYEGNRQQCFLIVCDLLIEISVDQTHCIMMKKRPQKLATVHTLQATCSC